MGLLSSIAEGTRRLASRNKLRRTTRRFHRWSSADQLRLDFYKQFVSKGAVVFDVGANVGNRAKVFHKLGAHVVAVEPQPSCADFLASVFEDQPRFHLVRKALGRAPGQSEMLIANSTTLSTLSSEWVEAMKTSGRFAGATWEKSVAVDVDTMDNLIDEFGIPDFVKIDVEGFEEQVIAGLTRPVRLLSLEVTPEFLGKTARCIDMFCSIGPCLFQVSFGESMAFALDNWVSADQIRERLSQMKANDFGDLYVCFDL
jgi:FkbM family methyltransferase